MCASKVYYESFPIKVKCIERRTLQPIAHTRRLGPACLEGTENNAFAAGNDAFGMTNDDALGGMHVTGPSFV